MISYSSIVECSEICIVAAQAISEGEDVFTETCRCTTTSRLLYEMGDCLDLMIVVNYIAGMHCLFY